MTDALRFRPWKSPNFEKGIDGVRLLIVGESHYSKIPVENDDPDFTIKIVEKVIEGSRRESSNSSITPNVCSKASTPHLAPPRLRILGQHSGAESPSTTSFKK